MRIVHMLLASVLATSGPLVAESVSQKEAASPIAENAPLAFSGGAESLDALVDRFVAAMEAKDEAGLRRLLVTEDEYREIIVPGRVPHGAAPRRPAKRNVDYFWSTMSYKSEVYAHNLVKDFGGRKYKERKLDFSEEPKRWAWYTAHGELQILLVPEEGPERFLLHGGWIAEVGGVFKFLTYEYDT